jgi:hypothetical protein
MRKTAFIVSLLFMFNSFGQQVIDIEFNQPIIANETQKQQVELSKPLGVPINYTLRFKDFNRPDLSNKATRQMLQFSDEQGLITENNLNKPYATVVYSTDSSQNAKDDHVLEIKIFIPNNYFRMDKESFNLYFSHYEDFNLISKAMVSVTISCEQPEFLSLQQWNDGKFDDLEVVRTIQKEDYLQVQAHRAKNTDIQNYKIRLRAHERFETSTPLAYSKSTLGLIHVPYKARMGVDALTTHSQVSLTNIGVHWGIWNHEKHTYFAHGSAAHESLGIGAFILPSLQRVRFVTDDTALRGYSVKEPFNASFFGFGLTLNYTYNGFGLYLIPFAVDIQTSAEQFHKALHAGRIWFGLGIGYTPSRRFSQRN